MRFSQKITKIDSHSMGGTGKTKVGEMKAIIPMMSGSAYIIVFNPLLMDETDPIKNGLRLKEFR